MLQELIFHEAIVLEAYKDSVGVWTWSVGITNSSGHLVHPRYKDKPASLEKCLRVFEWVCRNKYLPAVNEVFDGFNLSEAQAAAALSFHYNTGGLRRASWARLWKEGDVERAHKAFMNWRKPPEIVSRREKERDLFFEGTWTNDGLATIYGVKKPGYSPDFGSARRESIDELLQDILSQ